MSGNQLAQDVGGLRLPLNFQKTITNLSWPGPVQVGKVAAGFVVNSVQVKVITAFNGSASLTIGETSAQANLVIAADVFLDIPGTYSIRPAHPYTASTIVNAYLTGSPTTGSCEIIVFYQ